MTTNSVVWAAAGSKDIDHLTQVLSTHRHLIDSPFKMNRWKKQTPMQRAAEQGNELAIEALVRLGSTTIDTPSTNGVTPLHSAASNGHVAVIDLLVRLGSKAIDTPDRSGRTPLSTATANDFPQLIEALIRLGSNAIDTPNDRGCTPLHLAAMKGSVDTIVTLLRLGSKAIDIRNSQDAADEEFAGAIVHIHQTGSLPRDFGRTPVQAALGLNRLQTAKLLKAVEANPTLPLVVQTHCIELTEDEVVEMRYAVYFGHSFVYKLLFCLDRLSNTLVQARIP